MSEMCSDGKINECDRGIMGYPPVSGLSLKMGSKRQIRHQIPLISVRGSR